MDAAGQAVGTAEGKSSHRLAGGHGTRRWMRPTPGDWGARYDPPGPVSREPAENPG